MNQLALMTVKFRLAIACSISRFASPSGEDRSGGCQNETKTNRFTSAALEVFTRFSCPAASTDSIESPGCRESVEDDVEMTASTPVNKFFMDSKSFKSPTHISTPHERRVSTLSGELVA